MRWCGQSWDESKSDDWFRETKTWTKTALVEEEKAEEEEMFPDERALLTTDGDSGSTSWCQGTHTQTCTHTRTHTAELSVRIMPRAYAS